MWIPSRPLAWIALVGLAACVTDMSDRERLTTAVREFNDGIRWGRLDQAVTRVPPDARKRFLARRSGLEDTLEISDLDVQQMNFNNTTAQVIIDVRWSLKSRGLLERTVIEQAWRKRDSQWLMEKETRIRGAPLMLFDEPARPSSVDAGEAPAAAAGS